jgi:hypothetical protein
VYAAKLMYELVMAPEFGSVEARCTATQEQKGGALALTLAEAEAAGKKTAGKDAELPMEIKPLRHKGAVWEQKAGTLVRLRYTPEPGFTGTDTLSYKLVAHVVEGQDVERIEDAEERAVKLAVVQAAKRQKGSAMRLRTESQETISDLEGGAGERSSPDDSSGQSRRRSLLAGGIGTRENGEADGADAATGHARQSSGGKRFSVASTRALQTLEQLKARLRQLEAREVEAGKLIRSLVTEGFGPEEMQVKLGSLKSDIAQLHGHVETLQCRDIDGVLTQDLTSGRQDAREVRKMLNKQAEELSQRILKLNDDCAHIAWADPPKAKDGKDLEKTPIKRKSIANATAAVLQATTARREGSGGRIWGEKRADGDGGGFSVDGEDGFGRTWGEKREDGDGSGFSDDGDEGFSSKGSKKYSDDSSSSDDSNDIQIKSPRDQRKTSVATGGGAVLHHAALNRPLLPGGRRQKGPPNNETRVMHQRKKSTAGIVGGDPMNGSTGGRNNPVTTPTAASIRPGLPPPATTAAGFETPASPRKSSLLQRVLVASTGVAATGNYAGATSDTSITRIRVEDFQERATAVRKDVAGALVGAAAAGSNSGGGGGMGREGSSEGSSGPSVAAGIDALTPSADLTTRSSRKKSLLKLGQKLVPKSKSSAGAITAHTRSGNARSATKNNSSKSKVTPDLEGEPSVSTKCKIKGNKRTGSNSGKPGKKSKSTKGSAKGGTKRASTDATKGAKVGVKESASGRRVHHRKHHHRSGNSTNNSLSTSGSSDDNSDSSSSTDYTSSELSESDDDSSHQSFIPRVAKPKASRHLQEAIPASRLAPAAEKAATVAMPPPPARHSMQAAAAPSVPSPLASLSTAFEADTQAMASASVVESSIQVSVPTAVAEEAEAQATALEVEAAAAAAAELEAALATIPESPSQWTQAVDQGTGRKYFWRYKDMRRYHREQSGQSGTATANNKDDNIEIRWLEKGASHHHDAARKYWQQQQQQQQLAASSPGNPMPLSGLESQLGQYQHQLQHQAQQIQQLQQLNHNGTPATVAAVRATVAAAAGAGNNSGTEAEAWQRRIDQSGRPFYYRRLPHGQAGGGDEQRRQQQQQQAVRMGLPADAEWEVRFLEKSADAHRTK